MRKKPYKILYFHHATQLGGAPRSLYFLISGLDRREFEPIVVLPKRSNNVKVKKLFTDAGARIIEEVDIRPFHGSTVAPNRDLKGRAYALLSYIKTVSAARRIVAQQKPDLVHLNSTALVAAAKGAHLANPMLKVVAHVREPLLDNWWGKMLASMNRRHVDWFISIDEYGLSSLKQKKQEGTVVYNFVDRNLFSKNPEEAATFRKAMGWDEESVVFLSLSRVAESNGAIETAKLIASTDNRLHTNAKFVFAGFENDPEEYAIRAKKVLEITNRCSTMPFSNDVVSLIDASDVIIAPFITPHSARSVFEGAALGTPGLVSDLPNLKELIVQNETGYVFNWKKEGSFVDSVNSLCNNETRTRMGLAAEEYSKLMFDQKRNTEKIMSVYRTRIEQPNPLQP